MNMNKKELGDALAEELGWTKAAGARAADTALLLIMRAVAGGDTVALAGFGVFEPATRAARDGRNPKTGQPLAIPATVVPKFRAGSTFKSMVATPPWASE
jgi:DNA-binding protein HU-beta